MKEKQKEFIVRCEEAMKSKSFVKLTLSKTIDKNSELRNVYVKPVLLKVGLRFSFTYRYLKRDEVKNYDIRQAIEILSDLIENDFYNAAMFTIDEDISLIVNSNGVEKIIVKKIKTERENDFCHDRQKNRLLDAHNSWWFQLGLTNREGELIPSMQHKFKQICKYTEIVDGLIRSMSFSDTVRIADMGAGKGYLTFALYEYLTKNRNLNVDLKGVEIRPDLVLKTNEIIKSSNLQGIEFVEGSINDYKIDALDILIALHACDTATDDAIASGIKSQAKLIVCAPCCHKQIRQSITANKIQNPVIQYGIFLERQAVLITDTIRALIMEYFGYKTQIMEFIETEHTPKNILLVGRKHENIIDKQHIMKQIQDLKNEYGIEKHYLETILEECR